MKILSKSTTHNDKFQQASYLFAYQIAKEKVPYTYGEKFILPATFLTTVLDEKLAEKIKCVPVSDTTVSRRIRDIAEDLEFQLVSRLQAAEECAILLE